jgi:hypothetical protein
LRGRPAYTALSVMRVAVNNLRNILPVEGCGLSGCGKVEFLEGTAFRPYIIN